MTVVAETIEENNIDNVVSQLNPCNNHLTQIVDSLLESDNIITSFDDLVMIVECPIDDQNKLGIMKKYIRFCDSVDNIITLMNQFIWPQERIELIKLCKNKIKKISDLKKILIKFYHYKLTIIKIFDFIGITYPNILDLVNMFSGFDKILAIQYLKDFINIEDTIKLVNESNINNIYNIFSVGNFDELIDIIMKLNSIQHRRQLAKEYTKLFDGQNIFKYLELLTDFSSQFEFIKSIYKELFIENPLELLKCVNGVTEQDDENRKQLLEFIVNNMNVIPNTKCLDDFVTEEGQIKMIDYLVKSSAIRLNSVTIKSENSSISSEDSTSLEETTSYTSSDSDE